MSHVFRSSKLIVLQMPAKWVEHRYPGCNKRVQYFLLVFMSFETSSITLPLLEDPLLEHIKITTRRHPFKHFRSWVLELPTDYQKKILQTFI